MENQKNNPNRNSRNFKLLIALFVVLLLVGVTLTVLSFFTYTFLLYMGIIFIIIAVIIPCVLLVFQYSISFLGQITPVNPVRVQTVSTGKLNYQNFEKISNGTTIAQANAIFGEGKESFKGRQGNSEIVTMVWQESPVLIYMPVAKTVTIKFQDGRAIEKSQIGL